MQTRKERIAFTLITALVAFLGFESLIYILNLDQVAIFLRVAMALYLYLMLKVLFLYDLHFKSPGNFNEARQKHIGIVSSVERYIKIYFSTLSGRTRHFWERKSFGLYFNYLLLPTLIFWSTVIMLYLNFGYLKFQQLFAVSSTIAAVAVYWNIKEVFSRRKEIVDTDLFIRMTVAKLYTAAIAFGASLAILRSFCLSPLYFLVITFCITFSLIFQALFQHRLTNAKNFAIAFCLSLLQAVAAFYVYSYWGLNFYSGGVVLTVSYNLLWGTFHYYLDRALTAKAFFEILLFSIIIAAMLFGITNFKAKLLDGCNYSLGL